MNLESLFGHDLKAALFVVANLIIIESLLSIDNAAVLATMVKDLPEKQKGKALKYGILGAYVFRGICLIFASLLVKVVWLKALGGLYLVWLCVDYFFKKSKPKADEDNEEIHKERNWFYKLTVGKIGVFWSSVILIEIMDLAFSIDNVFAAVAFTDKIGLICLGVFIGILAMRFAAQIFVQLMTKFPFLDEIAFLVIGFLGMKLVASYGCHLAHTGNQFCIALDGHNVDLWTSIITIGMFALPVLSSIVFDFPKKNKP